MSQINLLLYGPQHYDNLCQICRSAENFGIKELYIQDLKGLFKNTFYDHFKRRLNRMSGGTFSKIEFRHISNGKEFVETWPGRVIASHVGENSESLNNFVFKKGDLIILGSESSGIPTEIENLCDVRLQIPSLGTVRSLNLSTAVSIFLFEAHRQLSQESVKR